MKKYKNLKTGVIVEANGILTGKNWEEVKEAETEKAAEKKTTKKAAKTAE